MVDKTKQHFIDTVTKAGSDYAYLLRHLPQVEKWAKKLLDRKPEADKEVALMGVWLHDIGQVIGNKETDHAVNSETEAKRFLAEIGANPDLISRVAHCARAHRCKDVQPETIEAKVLAVADSASHMTDIVYIDMANRGDLEGAKAKLERDYRDISLFPELKEEIAPLYQAWTKLLGVWPNS